MSPKRITESQIIGDKGIALIHKIVADMGFIWNPTGLEAGIDGYIELRDPVTGLVTNQVIQVQSRATDGDFQAETPGGFDYLCEARDLDYWLGGNGDVILVRSRPSTNEAYWVSLKDYFENLSVRGSRKIHFNKSKDRFDVNCRETLVSLAKPRDSGIYLSPLPKNERLFSNLLEVLGFAKNLYIAETDYRQARDLWNKFSQMGINVGGEWILKNKQLISFHNLKEYPWCEVYGQREIRTIETAEWAYSQDQDLKRDFVQLLNQSLKQKLWPDVRFDKAEGYYFFAPTKDLCPRILSYKSLAKETSRIVFQAYPKKKDPTKISYYRHSAFNSQFVKFGDAWHLEITPTYHYTLDGYRPSWYREDQLKGIKQRERNPAVLGQVVMWAEYLKEKEDLFVTRYPFLTLGSLVTYDIEAGLDDKVWLGHEERDEAELTQSQVKELKDFPLFDLSASEV